MHDEISRRSGRIRREATTIEVMIREYCRSTHQHGSELCADCAELLDYARRRLARCPFQEGKTTCGKCPIHCYRPDMRARVREVMRRIGPRMLLLHPWMGLRHAIDGLRRSPRRPTPPMTDSRGNDDTTP
ncbi:MAG: hypothetical protein BWK76_24895 [Desulfobulbaceae bacterium A2]|nr:MAG: hypothetical protein BWK76_24895 [Desulfobulbaceae bacterium A2]